MQDPEKWFVVLALSGLAMNFAASWSLHNRLKSRNSLYFLVSMGACLAWLPLSQAFIGLLLMYANTDTSGRLINLLVMFVEVIAPGLLMLVTASTFWLTARTVAPR